MGYDIIVLAGQSNAEGTGLGDGPVFQGDERILRLYDPQDNGFAPNENGEMILKVKRPWEFLIAPAEERFCDGCNRASFGLWFATEYIKHGLLQDGRKILMVNAAVGGTGFKRGHWGRGEILSERLYEMLDKALLGEENKIVAFLWHQGEHDVFENMTLPRETVYENYRASLSTFFGDVRKKYSQCSFPILAAGFSEQYCNQNEGYRSGCDTVLRATKSVCAELENAAVIDTFDLRSNDQASGNGDLVHFCRESLYELGKRYFEKYLQLLDKSAKKMVQ